jgi:hypothetical protein
MESIKRLPGRKPYVAPEDKLIPHNFTLHPRHLQRLRAESQRRRVPLSVVLREVLDRWVDEAEAPAEEQPTAGAQLVEELTASGFIGAWEDRTDIGDSVEFARRLRRRAETRADRFDAEEIRRLGGRHPAGPAGEE